LLLRYIARVASLPNFYGQNAYESGQIDEWLEYASVFSLGPAFDKIYVMVVVGAANEPHFESEAEKFVKYTMTCR